MSRTPHSDRQLRLHATITIINVADGYIASFRPHPGDEDTYADIDATTHDFGFHPTTPIAVGLPKFVDWYRAYQLMRFCFRQHSDN